MLNRASFLAVAAIATLSPQRPVPRTPEDQAGTRMARLSNSPATAPITARRTAAAAITKTTVATAIVIAVITRSSS